jgi:DNA uptake protein ComE-like DNA-binding protein
LRDETLVRLLLFILVFFIATSVRAAERAWERWEGCTLAADRYFDGDSFHVRHRGAGYVLRLYFVDAPETGAGYGTRVAEQAAYFGVKDDEVLRGGAAAKELVAKFLGAPFRVITRRQTAPGASRAERLYAIIERDGWRLDAALIQAGLARATSEIADFPDAAGGQQRAHELRSLEQKAAQERQGLWAKSQRADRKAGLIERLTPRLFKSAAALPAPRKVNLNTASQLDLEALPGIGPKTAEAIIVARPLRSFEQLDAVRGIGPKKIEALRNLVSFE